MTYRDKCPACSSIEILFSRKKCGYDLLVCSCCKTEFADLKPDDLPSYDDHYKEIYGGYIKMLLDAKNNKFPLYWYQKKILKIVGCGNGKLHLDIGSGLGTFPHITARYGWVSVGTDISVNAAAIATKELGVKTLIGELPTLNLKNESYGWISAFEVLEHVYEPRLYVEQINKILLLDGIITLSVPNGLSRDERETIDPIQTPPTHINFFSRKGLNKMMDNFGFSPLWDFEKFIPWSELKRPITQRVALIPLLVFNSIFKGERGNRLVWVGKKIRNI
jgi:SAM-dependent methyltransferase